MKVQLRLRSCNILVPWMLAVGMVGCATFPDIKEIKAIGYSDDVSRGKPVGQIEAADCVWRVFGYQLGSYPDLAKALANARTQKSSSTAEDLAGIGSTGKEVRYVNNVSVNYDSFDAYVVGRTCIKVKGLGYT